MVYSKITKAVRRVEMKKYVFWRCGCFLAMKVQANLMRYSIVKAVRPIAASSLVLGRYLRVSMKTLYVTPLGSKPGLAIPIKAGTWPTAMLMADPVMKAEMETKGIKSTIHPTRKSPMAVMIHPAMTAKDEARTWPSNFGWVFAALATIWPTKVDMTATGYTGC